MRVLHATSMLALVGLHVEPAMLTCHEQQLTSEPQEKLPESSLKALNLKLPPRTRTRLTVTFEESLVLPG